MVPAPLVSGTIIYAVLAAVLLALSMGALATGMISKDNAG
jgi:hypothetical protein